MYGPGGGDGGFSMYLLKISTFDYKFRLFWLKIRKIENYFCLLLESSDFILNQLMLKSGESFFFSFKDMKMSDILT